MAARFPRPLARRDILYGPGTPRERLLDLGHAYLEAGLVFDAADFFAQARDREGLEIVRGRAREMGDAFLLRQVQTAMPDLVSKSDWDALARSAAALGKAVYAERAEAGGAPPPPPLQEEEEPEDAGEEGVEEEGPEGLTQETVGRRARRDRVPKRPGRGRKRAR